MIDDGFAFIYGIENAPVENSRLLEFRDRGRETDTAGFDGPELVGTGWNAFPFVFPGRGNVIYAVTKEGVLKRWTHLGATTLEFKWQDSGIPVAEGFGDFKRGLGGMGSVIYGVHNSGDLFWFKDVGTGLEGPKLVGSGFKESRFIFPGELNVIYNVNARGQLVWRRHIGVETGERAWSEEKIVSDGVPIEGGEILPWNRFQFVFTQYPRSTVDTGGFFGDGFIYLIVDDPNQHLYRYRHFGWKEGTRDFAASALKIHEGFNIFVQVFAARLS